MENILSFVFYFLNLFEMSKETAIGQIQQCYWNVIWFKKKHKTRSIRAKIIPPLVYKTKNNGIYMTFNLYNHCFILNYFSVGAEGG